MQRTLNMPGVNVGMQHNKTANHRNLNRGSSVDQISGNVKTKRGMSPQTILSQLIVLTFVLVQMPILKTSRQAIRQPVRQVRYSPKGFRYY